ncbi:MAG: dual specificity protein phosphatase family protein [Campylobacterota bacterium]|nr:dual specificity protein phosphatase family protein [Campylobacterota bacterium]
MIKNIFKVLGIFALLGGAFYVWHVHFNYRFEEISKDKVYKSALIAPDKIESFLIKNKIKTVIDLLDPGVQDDLNPAKQKHIDKEDAAIAKVNKKHNLNIKHINIASGQVPTKETLKKFYKVLDDKSNYPVLIHCYHGTGRAQVYSAIYRLEYEGWKNEDARAKTRFIVEGFGYRSSFAKGKGKGNFLINYKPRSSGENSTLNLLSR